MAVKLRILLLVLLLFALSLPASSSAQAVTLNNPGFETWSGTNITSWYMYYSGTATRITTPKRSGTYAASIGGTYICQDVTVGQPGTYTFSVWARSITGTSNATIGIWQNVAYSYGGYNVYALTATYTQISMTSVINGAVSLCIGVTDASGTTFYADDATITYVAPLPTYTPAPTPTTTPGPTPTILLVTPTPTPIPYEQMQTEIQKQTYVWQVGIGISVVGLLALAFVTMRR